MAAINEVRRRAGASDIRFDMTIARLASVRVKEVKLIFDDTGSLSHTRPGGRKFSTVWNEYGISKPLNVGENITFARRFSGAADMVSVWMDSQQHKSNLLDPKYHRFGMAKYDTSYGPFAVVLLAS